MVQKQMHSVLEVARLLDVHKQVVLEWAERAGVDRVGGEYLLSPRNVRDCDHWLNAAGSAADADVSGDGDDTNAIDEEEDGDGDDDDDEDDDDDDDEDDEE